MLNLCIWLKTLDEDNTEVFYLCYNKKSFSREFMRVKETAWKNSHVPYVRYYRDGSLVNESNYAGKTNFLVNFGS